MECQPFVEYHPYLINSLRDTETATLYLNAVLEDGDVDLIVLALQNVAEAQGGMDKLAEKIHFTAA